MIFSQLAYGLVILTYFGDGTPMFDADPPTPFLNAGTLIELAEGVNERQAAIQGYDVGYEQEGTAFDIGNILYAINEDFMEIPFTYTEVTGTNAGYTAGGFDFRPTNGTWKAWSFNALIGNPPYQGSRASYAMLKQCAGTIGNLAPWYVQSFTPTSAVYWTASNLWVAAGGEPFTNATFGFVSTSQLWQVYRALTNLTTTVYHPGIVVTTAQMYATAYGAGETPNYGGIGFTNELGTLGENYTTEEVSIDVSNNSYAASKAIWHGYVVPPNLASGVVANIDASYNVQVRDIDFNIYAEFQGSTMTNSTTCDGTSTNFGPVCQFDYSAPEMSTLMDLTPTGENASWVSYILWPRGVLITWEFSRCHP